MRMAFTAAGMIYFPLVEWLDGKMPWSQPE
jgi:hypothetical protein